MSDEFAIACLTDFVSRCKDRDDERELAKQKAGESL